MSSVALTAIASILPNDAVVGVAALQAEAVVQGGAGSRDGAHGAIADNAHPCVVGEPNCSVGGYSNIVQGAERRLCRWAAVAARACVWRRTRFVKDSSDVLERTSIVAQAEDARTDHNVDVAVRLNVEWADADAHTDVPSAVSGTVSGGKPSPMIVVIALPLTCCTERVLSLPTSNTSMRCFR